eukprot:6515631-Ditylum_brightwellii.AAC.1
MRHSKSTTTAYMQQETARTRPSPQATRVSRVFSVILLSRALTTRVASRLPRNEAMVKNEQGIILR